LFIGGDQRERAREKAAKKQGEKSKVPEEPKAKRMQRYTFPSHNNFSLLFFSFTNNKQQQRRGNHATKTAGCTEE